MGRKMMMMTVKHVFEMSVTYKWRYVVGSSTYCIYSNSGERCGMSYRISSHPHVIEEH